MIWFWDPWYVWIHNYHSLNPYYLHNPYDGWKYCSVLISPVIYDGASSIRTVTLNCLTVFSSKIWLDFLVWNQDSTQSIVPLCHRNPFWLYGIWASLYNEYSSWFELDVHSNYVRLFLNLKNREPVRWGHWTSSIWFLRLLRKLTHSHLVELFE